MSAVSTAPPAGPVGPALQGLSEAEAARRLAQDGPNLVALNRPLRGAASCHGQEPTARGTADNISLKGRRLS